MDHSLAVSQTKAERLKRIPALTGKSPVSVLNYPSLQRPHGSHQHLIHYHVLNSTTGTTDCTYTAIFLSQITKGAQSKVNLFCVLILGLGFMFCLRGKQLFFLSKLLFHVVVTCQLKMDVRLQQPDMTPEVTAIVHTHKV